MKFFVLLFLYSPFFCFSQVSENEMQKEIQKFILRYKVNDVTTYSSIRYSKIDTLYEMSSDDVKLKKSLIEKQYQLFSAYSKDSVNFTHNDYQELLKKYNEDISQLENKPKVVKGFRINHTYKSKNRRGDLVNFQGDFYFDSKGKLIESSIKENSADTEKGS